MTQEKAAPLSTTKPPFPLSQRQQRRLKLKQPMVTREIGGSPPKYLEIGSVLLHVLFHAQAELLNPLPLSLHGSAVRLGNTNGDEQRAFTSQEGHRKDTATAGGTDTNGPDLAATRRVWTRADRAGASRPRAGDAGGCGRHGFVFSHPREKHQGGACPCSPLLPHHGLPASLDNSKGAEAVPCTPSLRESLTLCTIVSVP